MLRADPHDRSPLMVQRAWLALTAALALHVIDEALNDFLAVYNPAVTAIRAAAPFLPLPTFTFTSWLAGLTVAVVVLAVLGWRAGRSGMWVRPAGFVFAVLMILNGLLHLTVSAVQRSLMPGTWSAPVLLVAAIVLFRALSSSRTRPRVPDILRP